MTDQITSVRLSALYQISLTGTCRIEGGSAALSQGTLGPPKTGSGHRGVVLLSRPSPLHGSRVSTKPGQLQRPALAACPPIWRGQPLARPSLSHVRQIGDDRLQF